LRNVSKTNETAIAIVAVSAALGMKLPANLLQAGANRWAAK
jgi:hypothetical protein